jgi:hypothetical protein
LSLPKHWLLFLASLLGCARAEVHRTPTPTTPGDLAEAIRWRNESPVNLSIERLIDGGMFFWGQWRVSSSITVVESGQASIWQAIAIESRSRDVVDAGPCHPDGGIELYAWRPSADSTGIESIMYWTPFPGQAEPASFGVRRECPPGVDYFGYEPRLSRGALHATLRLPVGHGFTNLWTASSGEGHVGVLGPVMAGSACPRPMTLSLDEECEEVSFGATIHARIREAGQTPADTLGRPVHDLSIGPAVITGVRLTRSCASIRGCGEATEAAMKRLLPSVRAGLHPRTLRPQWPWMGMADRYLATWRGDSVLRTVIQVRFPLGTSDSLIALTLARWRAAPVLIQPAGTIVLQVPDPGPGAGAFDRMVDRLRRTRAVTAVNLLDAHRFFAVGPRGRVQVRAKSGPSLEPEALICLGLPGESLSAELVASFCRTATRSRPAVFDSLAVGDASLFAACIGRGGRPVTRDSTAVRIEPARTVSVEFRSLGCGSEAAL